jgi:hypothetical protein
VLSTVNVTKGRVYGVSLGRFALVSPFCLVSRPWEVSDQWTDPFVPTIALCGGPWTGSGRRHQTRSKRSPSRRTAMANRDAMSTILMPWSLPSSFRKWPPAAMGCMDNAGTNQPIIRQCMIGGPRFSGDYQSGLLNLMCVKIQRVVGISSRQPV